MLARLSWWVRPSLCVGGALEHALCASRTGQEEGDPSRLLCYRGSRWAIIDDHATVPNNLVHQCLCNAALPLEHILHANAGATSVSSTFYMPMQAPPQVLSPIPWGLLHLAPHRHAVESMAT